MSETIGNPMGTTGGTPSAATATATAAPSSPRPTARGTAETVHEAYSFACLSCGYGWEQQYEIEHHTDRDGHLAVQYRANGVRVRSPLLHPNCPGCGGHTVRIMGAGRVAAVDRHWERNPGAPGPHPGPLDSPGAVTGEPLEQPPAAWHLPRLRLPFLRRRGGNPQQ